MRKIDRYVMKSFLKSIILGSLAFLVVFILSELFRIVGYIVDNKITVIEGGILLAVSLPDVIVNVVPLGVLLGGLMTINKMASSLEIIALKTSGVSFKRIVLYPIILCFFISAFLLWFNDRVVPISNKKRRKMKYTDVYQVRESSIKTDVFMKGEGNYLYYIRLANSGTAKLTNVEIVELDDTFSDVKRIIVAKRAQYNRELKEWSFYKVKINDIEKDETINMEFYKPKFIKETPEDFLRDKVRADEKSVNDLRESIVFIRRTGGNVRKLVVELYKKIFFPFASFIMVFIGLSLGSRYVRGASVVSIGLSVVIGYSYYVAREALAALGVGGFFSPVLGALVPNLIFLVIGLITLELAEY